LTNALSSPSEPLSGARKVTFAELPKVTRDAIQGQAGAARIEDIEMGTLRGQTVYEAAFKRDGQHVELRVGEDGTILNQTCNSVAAEFRRLPGAVRDAIQANIGTSKITDIDVVGRGGKTVYEVQFDRDGSSRQLVFAPDGTLIRESDAVGTANVSPIIGRGSRESRTLTMDQLPISVQNTIRNEAGRSRIREINRQIHDGKIIYEVNFRQGAELREIEVSEEGALLRTKLVTTPSGNQIIGRSQPDRLRLRDLPDSVQRTVRDRAGAADVISVDKENWSGRTVYSIEVDRNGNPGEILVGEDGTVLKDLKP
jgi:uncharacterized membrane protein YkoI